MAAVRVFAFLLLVAFSVQVTAVPLPDGTLARLREALQAVEREYVVDGPSPARASAAAVTDWDALEQRARQLAQELQAELRAPLR